MVTLQNLLTLLGVCQGDPLSPYLFILVMEILGTTLKNDPTISGIKFNDSEYLASHADDTSLTLEDDPVSLEKCLQIFDKFGELCWFESQLRQNTGCLVWFWAWLWHRNLLWNQSGKFKVLGI
jgi:hypothetical protein